MIQRKESMINEMPTIKNKECQEFTPETAEEELMMIYGRLKAFEAYLNNTEFASREICAEMLGLTITKGKGEEK